MAIGGAARGGALAVVFWIAGSSGRAVLVSSTLPSVDFPMLSGAQLTHQLLLSFDAEGAILAAGDALYSFAGASWRNLGP